VHAAAALVVQQATGPIRVSVICLAVKTAELQADILPTIHTKAHLHRLDHLHILEMHVTVGNVFSIQQLRLLDYQADSNG
jgi:hypothetical protein